MGVLNDHIHDFIGTLFEDAEDPDLLADMVVNAVEAYRSVGGQWPVRERDEGDPHLLTFVEDVTRETSAVVTSDGHLRIDGDGWDFVEVHETSVWCAHCGLLGTDGQRAHGLLDDWEQV